MNEPTATAKENPVHEENPVNADPRQPLVSVVIPAYNAADTLPQTLDSIFAQTWPRVQIVVVDDGSRDDTAAVLAGYGARLTCETIPNSGGPSRPRNRGVALAGGEFIAFFDSDDLMEPDKLARAVEIFARHPQVGLVCSNFRSIDNAGAVLQEDYLADYRQFRAHLRPAAVADTGLLDAEDAFRELLRANFVGTSSVVCRREVLQEAGPFDEEMKNGDDHDMWLRIARTGATMAFIDRVLHAYRITPGGVTARGPDRVPAMIRTLRNQIPHCRREEDRRFLQRKIRELHFVRGWELREAGRQAESIASYRAGLEIGWSLRPWIACLKARLRALLDRN